MSIIEEKNRLPIFQERFKTLRGNLTQDKFAEKAGIARTSIGFYENGDRLPDALTLKKICEACNVTSDWLLGLSDVQCPNIDNIAINKRLGLSEEAIAKLEQERKESELYCDLALGFDIVDHMIKTGLLHKLSHDIAFSISTLYALPTRLKLKEMERTDLEKVKHNSDDDFNRYTDLGVEINKIKKTIEFTKWKITKTIDDMVFDTIENDLMPFYRDKSEKRAEKEAENKDNQDEIL